MLWIFSFWVNGTIGHLLTRSKSPGVPFDSFLSLIFTENKLKIPAHFSLKTYPKHLSPMLAAWSKQPYSFVCRTALACQLVALLPFLLSEISLVEARISFLKVKLYCVTPIKTFHQLHIAFGIQSNFLRMSAKPNGVVLLATSLSNFSQFCTSLTQLQIH